MKVPNREGPSGGCDGGSYLRLQEHGPERRRRRRKVRPADRTRESVCRVGCRTRGDTPTSPSASTPEAFTDVNVGGKRPLAGPRHRFGPRLLIESSPLYPQVRVHHVAEPPQRHAVSHRLSRRSVEERPQCRIVFTRYDRPAAPFEQKTVLRDVRAPLLDAGCGRARRAGAQILDDGHARMPTWVCEQVIDRLQELAEPGEPVSDVEVRQSARAVNPAKRGSWVVGLTVPILARRSNTLVGGTIRREYHSWPPERVRGNFPDRCELFSSRRNRDRAMRVFPRNCACVLLTGCHVRTSRRQGNR